MSCSLVGTEGQISELPAAGDRPRRTACGWERRRGGKGTRPPSRFTASLLQGPDVLLLLCPFPVSHGPLANYQLEKKKKKKTSFYLS